MIDEKVIEAFHIPWGSFPSSARLIHENRTVLNEPLKRVLSVKGFLMIPLH